MAPDPEPGAPELSVVAPLYGNAASLRELVERVRASLEGIDWELWLVDDASPDGAAELARELAAGEPRLGVAALAERGGQSEALRVGVLLSRGRRVALIDADLQDPPEILPTLLAAATGADLVFGLRRGVYQGWMRRLSSLLFKTLRAWICGVPRGAGLLILADGELLRAVARAAPKPCWWIPQLAARRPRLAALPVQRARRFHGVSAYRGLMRWRIGLGELVAALRWRLGRPGGAPRVEEPRRRFTILPGATHRDDFPV
jgi:glycosyltransferase involved in cell wall biosynthesis